MLCRLECPLSYVTCPSSCARVYCVCMLGQCRSACSMFCAVRLWQHVLLCTVCASWFMLVHCIQPLLDFRPCTAGGGSHGAGLHGQSAYAPVYLCPVILNPLVQWCSTLLPFTVNGECSLLAFISFSSLSLDDLRWGCTAIL